MSEEIKAKYMAKERENLGTFLEKNHSSIEFVEGEMGAEYMEQMLEGLAAMEYQIEHAANAAREGDVDGAAHLMGAGAMRTRDAVYGVLLQANGAEVARDGDIEYIKPTESAMQIRPYQQMLTTYIKDKIEGGKKQLEFIIANRF